MKKSILYKSFAFLFLTSILSVSILVPSVSAHGQYGKVVFMTNDYGSNTYEIAKINTDGSGMTRLTNSADYEGSPEVSPNGTKIIYHFIGDYCDEVHIMNVDGSGDTGLTQDVINDCDIDPSFSPDGTKIVYASEAGSERQIYTMNIDGSGKTQITSADRNYEPRFSPDGTKIIFRKGGGGVYGGQGDIYTVNSNGTGLTQITNTAGQTEWEPSFSPDGTKIVYSVDDDIYTADANGSNEQVVASYSSGSVQSPRYSPDGTAILYNRDYQLYLMNSNGSNKHVISASASIDDGSINFYPDTFPVSSYNYSSSFSFPTLYIDDDLSYWDYNYIGTLVVNGQSGDVTVTNGNYLKGTGTIGQLSVVSGGHVAPGLSPGCLTSGDTTLAGGFDVELGGTTECSEYDQLRVVGTIDISGATLNLSLYNNFTPKVNDTFTILTNDSIENISGNFTGLNEGSIVSIDGYSFRISYTGGDGNDIVLTTLVVPTVPNTGKAGSNEASIFLGLVSVVILVSVAFLARKNMPKN